MAIPKFDAMVTVKGYRPGLRFLNKLPHILGGTITPNYAKLNNSFLLFLNRLYKKGGIPMVVKYLKVSAVLVQQVCAGHVLPDLTPLGLRVSRDKTGLPRIIPSYQRKLIRQGNSRVIKYWLTLLSLYRDLHFSGVLKFSTITDPSKASSTSNSIGSLIKSFTTLYCKDHKGLVELQKFALFPILKSGPQAITNLDGTPTDEHNTHPSSIIRTFWILNNTWEGLQIKDSLLKIISLTNNQTLESLWARLVSYKLDKLISYKLKDQMGFINEFIGNGIRIKHKCLGKLSTKEEAAGKVRVFAMVDPFTQWALEPLHRNLFSILKKMETDGTFNQMKPISRIPWGSVPIYSFDLSAATDRLPISLQEDILSILYGKDFSGAWRALLVDRDYKTPKQSFLDTWTFKGKMPFSVRYKVGQPMGALSSWAMLAITHHYIVHYSAWISGVVPIGTKFSQYAVLGDDVVIWNSTVAEAYLKVMQDLGVEVGLAKSVLSPKGKGLEFAKRTLVNGIDVSPIPFKEQISAHQSTYNIRNFCDKYNLSPLAVLRFLGYGYQVSPEKDNMVNHVLRIIRLLPNTGAELSALFILNENWLPLPNHNEPNHIILKMLFNTVFSEIQDLHRDAKDALWRLRGFHAGAGMMSSGPWSTATTSLSYLVWEPTIRRAVSELEDLVAMTKYFINDNTFRAEFINSPFWDPIWVSQYLPSRRFLLPMANVAVEGRDLFERVQVDLMMRPVPMKREEPSRLYRLEKPTTLKLWNHWSNKINKMSKV